MFYFFPSLSFQPHRRGSMLDRACARFFFSFAAHHFAGLAIYSADIGTLRLHSPPDPDSDSVIFSTRPEHLFLFFSSFLLFFRLYLYSRLARLSLSPSFLSPFLSTTRFDRKSDKFPDEFGMIRGSLAFPFPFFPENFTGREEKKRCSTIGQCINVFRNDECLTSKE